MHLAWWKNVKIRLKWSRKHPPGFVFYKDLEEDTQTVRLEHELNRKCEGSLCSESSLSFLDSCNLTILQYGPSYHLEELLYFPKIASISKMSANYLNTCNEQSYCSMCYWFIDTRRGKQRQEMCHCHKKLWKQTGLCCHTSSPRLPRDSSIDRTKIYEPLSGKMMLGHWLKWKLCAG